MVQESIESSLVRRVQALEEGYRALLAGIPRLGELIALSDDGTVGTLEVWNQYGEVDEEAITIEPGGTEVSKYTRTIKGISSEVVTAFMMASAFGGDAVDYTRPTVRYVERSLSEEVDGASGTALDTIGNREGVTRTPGQSDADYRKAIIDTVDDDTRAFTRGEICTVLSVPPYNVAFPGVMTRTQGTTPLRQIAGSTLFAASPEAFGSTGSVRITGGGIIEGIGGVSGEQPMVIRFTPAGIQAQVNGQASFIAIPRNAVVNTGSEDNPDNTALIGSDEEGFDSLRVVSTPFHVPLGLFRQALPWGIADTNVIKLATKFYLDGAITSFRYATVDADGIAGAYTDGTVENREGQPNYRRIIIPADAINPSVLILLRTIDISNDVQLQRAGSSELESVAYGSITLSLSEIDGGAGVEPRRAQVFVTGNTGVTAVYTIQRQVV